MGVEFILIFVAVLFVLGVSISVYHNRFTTLTKITSTISLLIMLWVIAASFMSKSVVVDVTYHMIEKETTPDGTVSDVIKVIDDDGEEHVVNINRCLGSTVPDDGNEYQVARVRFSQSSLGLYFQSSNKYRIVKE